LVWWERDDGGECPTPAVPWFPTFSVDYRFSTTPGFRSGSIEANNSLANWQAALNITNENDALGAWSLSSWDNFEAITPSALRIGSHVDVRLSNTGVNRYNLPVLQSKIVKLRLSRLASAGLALTLFNLPNAEAQSADRGAWEFRALGGFGRSSLSDSFAGETVEFESKNASTFGIEVSRRLIDQRMSLSAGLSYSVRGARFTIPPEEPYAGAAELQTSYVEIPVLLHASLGSLGPVSFRALGGGVFASNGDRKVKRVIVNQQIGVVDTKQFEMSATVGVEVRAKRELPVSVRLQYQRSLTAVTESPKSRSNMFMISGVWAIKRW